METVFVIPDSLKRGARRFAHCVHTDGVSMRLMTARPTQAPTSSSAASSSSQPVKRQRVALPTPDGGVSDRAARERRPSVPWAGSGLVVGWRAIEPLRVA